jgi:D-alanyl-D-alanine dipeptidase
MGQRCLGVRVDVVDGLLKASKVVRGPLGRGRARGHGHPAGVIGSEGRKRQRGFSPDVQHNRQWLRSADGAPPVRNLPNAWWHFAHQGCAATGFQLLKF